MTSATTQAQQAPQNQVSINNMPEVLTPEMVAQVLNIKPATVREYLKKQQLPGVKVGEKWFIPKIRLMQKLQMLEEV